MSTSNESSGTVPGSMTAGGWTPHAVTTGLGELDEIVGGVSPGELLIVTSAPGQGRSTLLTQLGARLAGEHKIPTWLISNRDADHVITGRMCSSAAKVPLTHIARDRLDAGERTRLATAHERVRSWPLTVVSGPYAAQRATPYLTGRSREGSVATVFDDPAWDADWDLHQARKLADAGSTVVVSLPRERVLGGPALRSDLQPDVAVADIIVEVRLCDFPRAGLDPHQEQPGRAAITVLRNRRGPTYSAMVVFQGHFARFVDRAQDDHSSIAEA